MKYALFDYYHGPNHPRKFAEHIEHWALADGFMNYAFVAEHHFDGDFRVLPVAWPVTSHVAAASRQALLGVVRTCG